MNPNAPEFKPPSKGQAWSNPAKSVHIAKLPPRRQLEENHDQVKDVCDKNQRDIRVLPRPTKVKNENKDDEEEAWQTIGKKGKTIEETKENKDTEEKEPQELSEEALELRRKQRRERRQRAKEVKKVKKEEERRKKEDEKLVSMRASKDTKIKVVDAGIITKLKNNSQSSHSTSTKMKGIGSEQSLTKTTNLKFLDEEYPTLGGATFSEKAKKSSKSVKSYESESEWETEDESSCQIEKENETVDSISEKIEKIEIVSEEKLSFKSILKKPPAKNPILNELSDTITAPVKKSKIKPLAATQNQTEQKKVKKKDPITFDIFDVLNAKKKTPATKQSTVLGSKIKPQIPSVRNALDSSAPAKRRGKEREKPKKKKPTKMKKLVLLSRADKKAIREANQAISLQNKQISQEIQEEKENQGISIRELTDENLSQHDEDFGESSEKLLHATNEIKGASSLVINENSPQKVPKDEIKVVEIPDQSAIDKAKILIHSRKFRNYCDHELSDELDKIVTQLVQDIVRFQDRQFAKDPVKAKAKKRYVVGLREIKKFLQVKKITLLILAPDVETVQIKGGLDDTISELIRLAKENEIPYVFSMNRWRLGKTCLRKVPISGIGVMNHQGSDENFHKIKEILPKLQSNYFYKFSKALQDVNAPMELINEFSTFLQ